MGIIARRAILGLFLFTLGPAFVGANFSVVRGRSDAEPQPGEEAEMCAAPDELHEVRCCSDRQLPGFTQQNGCGVWAESQFSGGIGCVENVDHQTAPARRVHLARKNQAAQSVAWCWGRQW